MVTWNDTQKAELLFWKNQNYPILEEYKQIYKMFDKYIEKIDKQKDIVMDVGCGAIAYTGLFGFSNLYLLDSLIEAYKTLDNTKTNINSIKVSMTIDAPLESIKGNHIANFADNVFCLNMLDHVNDPAICFSHVVKFLKVGGKLFFACDLRTNTDECHLHVLDKGNIDILVSGSKLKVIESGFSKKDNDIYLLVLEKL